MIEHSPSPWLKAHGDVLSERIILTADGHTVCTGITDDVDCGLIAAAPELFEACTGALDFIRRSTADGAENDSKFQAV